jgi:hypothetical protein
MNTTKRDTKAERPKTWAALQQWEATKQARDQLFDDAFDSGKMADVDAAINSEKSALQLVRDALWEDTQTYNRREDVDAMRIQDIQSFFSQS